MNLNDKQITRLRMIGYPIVTEKNQRVSDALQWFRDEKGLHGWIGIDSRGYYYVIYTTEGKYINSVFDYDTCFKNYSEAENALLDALLKYLEEKK